MKKYLLVFFFLSKLTYAQNYVPIDTADTEKRTFFTESFKKDNIAFSQTISTNYDSKTKRELNKSLNEFNDDFVKKITIGEFSFNKEFLDEIKSIVDEILAKNPTIPKDIKILLSKDGTLNAYCLANGTLVVNMGLFHYMDNEDQIAAIISHEIGHKIAQHALKTQLRRINEELSKENKSKIKEIKNAKYNKSEKALDLVKRSLYETGSYRRNNELQADSVGYALYKNTKYKKSEFIEALKLSEKYDTIKPIGFKNEGYKKYFDIPSQPFKQTWLENEDFSSYDYTKYKESIDKDSLASHPEIQERIARLKTNYKELLQKNKPAIATASFSKLEKTAQYEQVPNLYFSEQYGDAIYLCLLHLQKGTNDTYYKEWLGKNFQKIYQGRKTYTLNRSLERIVPKEQSKSYQQYLSFMWNLSLEEIKNIANFYTKKDPK